MGKIEKISEKKKQEKNKAEAGQEVKETKVGETPTPETPEEKTPTPETPEEKTAEQAKKEIEELLGDGEGDPEGEKNPDDEKEPVGDDKAPVIETQHFNGNKGGKINKDPYAGMTPEEKAKAIKEKQEKDRKAAERERRIKEQNELVAAQLATVKSQVPNADKKFTDGQVQFRIACSNNYVIEAFVVEKGPNVDLGISRTIRKDKDKNIIWKPNATEAIKAALTGKTKDSSYNKYEYQENDAFLKYRMTKASNIVAAVISMPRALAIKPVEFEDPQFKAPSREEIEASGRTIAVLDVDTLFAYLSIFCHEGTCKEAPRMKEAYAVGAEIESSVKASTSIATRTKKNSSAKTTYNKRNITLDGTGRKSLLVQENIIPIKSYIFEDMLGASEETRQYFTNKIAKALGKKDGESLPVYDYLTGASEKVIHAEVEEGVIKNLTLDFLTGQEIMGVGVLADYQLTHWSHSSVVDSQTTAEVLSAVLPKCKSRKSKDDSISYSIITRELGTVTFKDLADEFPAVKHMQELGVTEQQILKVYKTYKEKRDAQRRAKAASNPSSQTKAKTKAIDTHLNDEMAARTALAAIASGDSKDRVDLGMAMSPEEIRRSMISVTLS